MRGLQSWEIWGAQRAHHVPGWPLDQLALGLPREQAVEMGNPAWPLVSSRSGFVNPGATYILDQMVDVGGSVLCTVFTSIPASTHYIAIAFPKLTIKMSPDIAQFPQGEERVQDHSKPLLWTNPCPKGPEAL